MPVLQEVVKGWGGYSLEQQQGLFNTAVTCVGAQLWDEVRPLG